MGHQQHQWVVVVGAGVRQKPLIQALKAIPNTGVLSIDQNKDAPGHRYSDTSIIGSTYDCTAYLDHIRHRLDNRPVAAVLTQSSGPPVRTVRTLSEALGLQSFSDTAAQMACSKIAFRHISNQILHNEPGFPISHAVLDDLSARVKWDTIGFPAIVKPDINKRGKVDISIVETPSDIDAAQKRAIDGSHSHQGIVEPFFEGKDYVYSMVVKDNTIHDMGLLEEHVTTVNGRLRGTSFVFKPADTGLSILRPYSHRMAKALDICNGIVTLSYRLGLRNRVIPIEMHLDFGGENLFTKLLGTQNYQTMLAFYIGQRTTWEFNVSKDIFGLSYYPQGSDCPPHHRGVETISVEDYTDKQQVYWKTDTPAHADAYVRQIDHLWSQEPK